MEILKTLIGFKIKNKALATYSVKVEILSKENFLKIILQSMKSSFVRWPKVEVKILI